MIPTRFAFLARIGCLVLSVVMSACTTTLSNTEKTEGYVQKIESFNFKVDVAPGLKLRISKVVPRYSVEKIGAVDEMLASSSVQKRFANVMRLSMPQLESQLETYGAIRNITAPTHQVMLSFTRPIEAFCTQLSCDATLDFDLKVIDVKLGRSIWQTKIVVRPPPRTGNASLPSLFDSPAITDQASAQQAESLAKSVLAALQKDGLIAWQELPPHDRAIRKEASNRALPVVLGAPATSASGAVQASAAAQILPNYQVSTQTLQANGNINTGGVKVSFDERKQFNVYRNPWPAHVSESLLADAAKAPRGSSHMPDLSHYDLIDFVRLSAPHLAVNLANAGVQTAQSSARYEIRLGMHDRVDLFCKVNACLGSTKVDVLLSDLSKTKVLWQATVVVHQPKSTRLNGFESDRKDLLKAVVDEMRRLALI
jgi:hypothetical protein